MAACFSHGKVCATSPILVLSQIPKLAECMQKAALPGIKVKSVDLPLEFNKNLHLTEEQLEEVKDAEILVCDKFLLANNYHKLPKLKWAHCTWAGLDGLFEMIPEQPEFVITKHGGDRFGAVMAEYVMCQILNHERGHKTHWKNQQLKLWGFTDRFHTYRSLCGLKVATLGVGNMAFGIAKCLQSHKATLFGLVRRPRPMFQKTPYYEHVSPHLDEILPNCDYIVSTLPSTPATQGLLNDSVLKMCLKKPVFINVGRGNIISEDELILALENEWLSAAILDVFETEPLPQSSRLWEMPQVTITPHVAAVSKPEHVAEYFFKVFQKYIDSSRMENTVNWDAGY